MRLAAGALLLLASCDDSEGDRKPRQPREQPAHSIQWEIGPTINGKNYSQGLPRLPTIFPDGWGFVISPTAEPHYITRPHGPLTGKSRIVMAYRVEGDGTIRGKGCTTPSAVTIYFQRAGDDWRLDGGRWWATFVSQPLAGAGQYSINAPLDGAWTSVEKLTAADPSFASAKANAARVGFTFGNCEGYGHGALATAPMRFVVTKFEVE